MIEKALRGSSRYWTWLGILAIFIGIGAVCYVRQFFIGQGLTGMGRDIGWGLYISQFTFLVGVAAGGLMLVLPYYVHNYKAFGRITILGEFLAIPALIMCLLFIMVDLGQPLRAMNMILHPTPNSMLFWDMCVLLGYLFLNLICSWVILTAERKEVAPPKWIYIFVYLSIPFAVSIHTVTAMLYCGLPGRDFWLSAITAPRFLASAFAAGPIIIVLACLLMKRIANFDAGKEAINKILTIIIYAALTNAFFVCLEFFVAYYSKIPGHMHSLDYLFFGIEHNGEMYNNLVPFMWTSVFLCFGGLIVLAWLKLSKKVMTDAADWIIAAGCLAVFLSLFIDKGLGFVLGGLAITPFETVVEYYPTVNEMGVTIGIWAVGIFMVTVLYKLAVDVEHEVEE
ncbi:polysulfide reductase NrfD [Desulforhopalus vacuolatus]|uniref:sulfate reduction electron transfer complex DsrMKJOP subunit DsrP n=1 Tax=Desulforhopalus vacuolatus TaxID=40414 RepID=UPI001962FC55|nr:NrfD/PsrC family molybdoenzyme membrane anchor subunit [Desulforhopalus vacuolatus]MBM9519938.1 polysulfide reductase NrfD [Desulforhopalus vacuolatus]